MIVNWKSPFGGPIKIDEGLQEDMVMATLRMDVINCNYWEGTIVNKKGQPQVAELRGFCGGANVVIVVGLDGVENPPQRTWNNANEIEQGKANIRFSANGKSNFSFDDFALMQLAVAETRAVLETF